MTTVLITAAGRGLGFELTRQYAAEGNRVLAVCRKPDEAHSLNALSRQSSGLISVHALDVTDGASVDACARELQGESIDILINVAGIIGGGPQGLQDRNFEVWRDAFEVNAIGPFRVVQAFLPMLASGARIMTITSQRGASTSDRGGLYAYSASKAAVNRVMRTLALDLKDRDVLVGLVHPGSVRTDMGGPKAQISPEESARGIRQVVANLTENSSGEFFRWDGERHPW